MPQLRVKVRDTRGTLTTGLAARIKSLEEAEERAQKMAARAATSATRANFKYRRELAQPRAGRSSTGGRMKQHLEWVVRNGRVEFNLEEANRQAPHWIIQEIGTGGRATLKHANQPNPSGRPKKGATYVRTVPKQKGRVLKGGLVFASNGRWSPTGSARDEQVHLASQVTGVPRGAPRIVISREIAAQSFVKKGAQLGFSEYRTSVLGAARQAFKKGKRS